jgi:hypothetical protein
MIRSSRFREGGTVAKQECVYRRTESGLKAWQEQDPALSPEHRQILGLINSDTHWDEVRKLLRSHADHRRFADLVERGLVESTVAAPDANLDFTGDFDFRSAV